MSLLVKANEATAARRRVYFQLVDAGDGFTPETGEAGGQPQVSVDGAAWTDTGIGVLVAIGNGRYYATLTQTLVASPAIIETRYKTSNTAECPGDSVQVVAFDPNAAAGLGLTNLDAASSTLATQASVNTVAGYIDTEVAAILAAVDTEVAAIKAKTDNLPAAPAATGDIPTAAAIFSAVLTSALTEAYATLGAAPTLAQLLFEVRSLLAEKSISGTTLTTKKLNGSTTAETFTLNDATSPTSLTRAS